MADYNQMRHRFDVSKLLTSVLSYKGVFYPGIFINWLRYDSQGYPNNKLKYNVDEAPALKTHIDLGTPIRKSDAMGRVHFMPVFLEMDSFSIEIPNAVISFKSKKTIVKTALPGANGTVKELISLDDYEIDIAGVVIGEDGNYPEEDITMLRDLWELNESVELICAVTDMWIGLNTKIVLSSVDIPEVGAFEDAQIIRFTAETDSEFQLIIEE